MMEWTIPEDYDLDIYVSTDAFISSDHDENEAIYDESDVLEPNIYDDEEGNSWISLNSVHWILGYNEPFIDCWNSLGLGKSSPILYEQ